MSNIEQTLQHMRTLLDLPDSPPENCVRCNCELCSKHRQLWTEVLTCLEAGMRESYAILQGLKPIPKSYY